MNEVSHRSDTKREQIYLAAVREFQDKGFREAKMDNISELAGASKRTVYKYFNSKEALFHELMRRHWMRFEHALTMSYQPDRTIQEQLTMLGRSEGQLLTDPEVMATSKLVVSEVLRSPHLVERNEEKTDPKASFVSLIAAAIKDGQLNASDPQQVADEFLSLIKGQGFWPVMFGAPVLSTQEMDHVVERSVQMVLSRYAATPDTDQTQATKPA